MDSSSVTNSWEGPSAGGAAGGGVMSQQVAYRIIAIKLSDSPGWPVFKTIPKADAWRELNKDVHELGNNLERNMGVVTEAARAGVLSGYYSTLAESMAVLDESESKKDIVDPVDDKEKIQLERSDLSYMLATLTVVKRTLVELKILNTSEFLCQAAGCGKPANQQPGFYSCYKCPRLLCKQCMDFIPILKATRCQQCGLAFLAQPSLKNTFEDILKTLVPRSLWDNNYKPNGASAAAAAGAAPKVDAMEQQKSAQGQSASVPGGVEEIPSVEPSQVVGVGAQAQLI